MMRRTLCVLAVSALGVTAAAQDFDPNYTGTYSIIGLDPATRELGMAVQSKAFAVGNRAIPIIRGERQAASDLHVNS